MPIPADFRWQVGHTLAGQQSIAGLTEKWTLSSQLTAGAVEGNRSIQRKPTQAHEEHANSTQEGPSEPAGSVLLAVRWQCQIMNHRDALTSSVNGSLKKGSA